MGHDTPWDMDVAAFWPKNAEIFFRRSLMNSVWNSTWVANDAETGKIYRKFYGFSHVWLYVCFL